MLGPSEGEPSDEPATKKHKVSTKNEANFNINEYKDFLLTLQSADFLETGQCSKSDLTLTSRGGSKRVKRSKRSKRKYPKRK